MKISIKQTIILTIFAVLGLTVACNNAGESAEAEELKALNTEKAESIKKGNKNLVLVELFTSEG